MLGNIGKCMIAVVLLQTVAHGVTVTFDEVASGTQLRSVYAWDQGVTFSDDFIATDHLGSPWGPPHSPSNVLTSVGSSFSWVMFGHGGPPVPPDPVHSVAAYFGTSSGAMIRITATHLSMSSGPVFVTCLVVGAAGESWDNRYIEISTTPDVPFDTLRFEGVNSQSDLLGFCLDDMTITLVPEPSSLLALAGGLAGLAGITLRRRRR